MVIPKLKSSLEERCRSTPRVLEPQRPSKLKSFTPQEGLLPQMTSLLTLYLQHVPWALQIRRSQQPILSMSESVLRQSPVCILEAAALRSPTSSSYLMDQHTQDLSQKEEECYRSTQRVSGRQTPSTLRSPTPLTDRISFRIYSLAPGNLGSQNCLVSTLRDMKIYSIFIFPRFMHDKNLCISVKIKIKRF
jgi:hypothetical protein